LADNRSHDGANGAGDDDGAWPPDAPSIDRIPRPGAGNGGRSRRDCRAVRVVVQSAKTAYALCMTRTNLVVRNRTAFWRTLTLAAPPLPIAAIAQQPSPVTTTAPAERSPDVQPPLPADAHVEQAMQLGGRALRYTATVGTIPVYGSDGKKMA